MQLARPHNGVMAKRGSELSEHILRAAKEVFLEVGFERASMDEVASRAKTSKRSLYAHFESKEKLFLAVIDFVRELFLARLGALDYDAKPTEALALFCAQYLQALRYESSVQMLRVCIAETARFPEGAAQHYDVMFTEIEARLARYFKTAFGISTRESTDAAQRLLRENLVSTTASRAVRDRAAPRQDQLEEKYAARSQSDSTGDCGGGRVAVREALTCRANTRDAMSPLDGGHFGLLTR